MVPHGVSVDLPEAGRLRSMAGFYVTTMKLAVQQQFQYRTANYFYMLGMIAGPVIYLVVWTTIADQQGGWDLGVHRRVLRRVLRILDGILQIEDGLWRALLGAADPRGGARRSAAPPDASTALRHRVLRGLEGRRRRALDSDRRRPLVHFDPTLDPRPLEIVVFGVSIWGAYLLRTMFQSILGMLCFWTTRGRRSSIFG